MTSACINNPHIGISPEKFLDHSPTYSSIAGHTPALSLAGEMYEQDDSSTNRIPTPENLSDLQEESDPDVYDVSDFEFRLEEPVNMLPADELFSDGKLFPLHFPVIHQEATSTSSPATDSSDVRCLDAPEPSRIINGVSVVDSFLHTLKSPKCSSKWKELLGLRKLYQNSSNVKPDNSRTTSPPAPGTGTGTGNGNGNAAIKSIKHFLYRSSKSPTDSSINLPLLNDADNDPASLPARHSLSSSSSGHDPDDLPRLSVDSDKPLKVHLNTNTNPNPSNPPRMKLVKTRTLSSDGSIRGVSTESPRMNSSGKIVFHSLERSSSSPSSFTGGSRSKHRGIERSYSGNVRITPVLNVPVCSLRGFPLFSSSQKHEGSSSNNNNINSNRGASNRQQMNNKQSKSDRS